MKQEKTKDEAKLLSKHYLRETRVAYKSAISMDLPPCLDWGQGGRKLGIGGKLESTATMKIDQKVERGNESIMTEKECAEKHQKTEKGAIQWGPTEWGNYHERYNDMNYQNWRWSHGWGN